MPVLKVIHYQTAAGHDPISEFLDALPVDAAAKCSVVIGWLESDVVRLHPKASEHLEGDTSELKVRHAGRQFRFFYAVDGRTAYLLVALEKKRQRVPASQIDLAQKRLKELRKRRGAQ